MHDGWRLLVSRGTTRRNNSVQPTESGVETLDDKIAHAETFYRSHGRPPIFKLTDAARPLQLDAALHARGYLRNDPTSVQLRDLPADVLPDPHPHTVRTDASPSAGWVESVLGLRGADGRDADAFRGVYEQIAADSEPSFFASVVAGEKRVAVGLGVLRDATLFLGEIATAPDARRQGLARHLVVTLMAAGAAARAQRALLQVVVANSPACSLYAALGFQEVYRYWYREAPDT